MKSDPLSGLDHKLTSNRSMTKSDEVFHVEHSIRSWTPPPRLPSTQVGRGFCDGGNDSGRDGGMIQKAKVDETFFTGISRDA